MVRIDADLFSPQVEGVLTVVHALQLVVVAEVGVAPQPAVDHMGQTLLRPNLTSTIIIGVML